MTLIERKALEWARRSFPHPNEREYWNRLLVAYESDPNVVTRLRQALKAREEETRNG